MCDYYLSEAIRQKTTFQIEEIEDKENVKVFQYLLIDEPIDESKLQLEMCLLPKNSVTTYYWSTYLIQSGKNNDRIVLDDGSDGRMFYNKNHRRSIIVRLNKSDALSYITLKVTDISEPLEYKELPTLISLKYDHTFNSYLCKINADYSRVVIITGDYNYGFKRSHREKCIHYIDILSCEYSSKVINVQQMLRRNISKHVPNETVDDFLFNCAGDKILIATVEKSFFLYSLAENKFGDVLKWKTNIARYNYVNHSKYGNVLCIITTDGDVYIVRDINGNLSINNCLKLNLNFHNDVCLLPNCTGRYGRSLIIRVKEDNACIYDLEKEKLISCLKMPVPLPQLDRIYADAFGEEFFFLGNDFKLYAYYVQDENITLKHLARKAVLRRFTPYDLRNMDLSNAFLRNLNI